MSLIYLSGRNQAFRSNPELLLGAQPFVVAADQIGIFLRNRIAIDRHDGFARPQTGKFLRHPALDNPKRVDHLVFKQIPLWFARMPLLFRAPGSGLFANPGNIEPQTGRLQNFFHITQPVGPLIKLPPCHGSFNSAAGASAS